MTLKKRKEKTPSELFQIMNDTLSTLQKKVSELEKMNEGLLKESKVKDYEMNLLRAEVKKEKKYNHLLLEKISKLEKGIDVKLVKTPRSSVKVPKKKNTKVTPPRKGTPPPRKITKKEVKAEIVVSTPTNQHIMTVSPSKRLTKAQPRQDWTWETWSSNLSVSDDKMTVSVIEKYGSVLSSELFKTGCHKWTIELTNVNEESYILIGICDEHFSVDDMLGMTEHSYAIDRYDGQRWNSKISKMYYNNPLNKGTKVTCVLNCDSKTLSYQINDQEMKIAFRNIKIPAYAACTMLSQGDRLTLL